VVSVLYGLLMRNTFSGCTAQSEPRETSGKLSKKPGPSVEGSGNAPSRRTWMADDSPFYVKLAWVKEPKAVYFEVIF
jgi:hypothetical protein